MSGFNEPAAKLIQVIDCVADIDDYPPLEKSENIDIEGSSTQKVVLVTGGAGNTTRFMPTSQYIPFMQLYY